MSGAAQPRAMFLARSRREKILAALFLVVLSLIWASTLITRWKEFSLRLRSEWATASSQNQWLENEDAIEQRYAETLAQLSDATLPPLSLVLQQIDALRPRYAFKFSVPKPRTQTRDQLVFHTIEISIEKARYEQLRAFQEELATTLPTVNLEQIMVRADRRQPENLDASLRLVAVELNK